MDTGDFNFRQLSSGSGKKKMGAVKRGSPNSAGAVPQEKRDRQGQVIKGEFWEVLIKGEVGPCG